MKQRGWSADVIAAVTLLAALTFAAALAAIGFYVGHKTRGSTATPATTPAAVATIDPQVAAGAHQFVAFACAQCHGMGGAGAVSPDVPALTQIGPQLTSAQLRSVIDHGMGVSANPAKPFMPVWGNVISSRQVDDLVAYIRAGLPAVPVIWVDLDDAAALRVMLSDNKTSDDANYNDAALAELLAGLANTESGLTGTGYSLEELQSLIDGMAGPMFEPVGVDEQGRLDEKKRCTCPECGHEFAPD